MPTALPDEYDAEHPVIEAIRQGDRYAFEEFAHRNGAWVRAVIFGVLGRRQHLDDVCQQAWMRFWEQLPKLRDAKRWRAWLYRLARNVALDAGREFTRQNRLVRGDGTMPMAASPSHRDEVADGERRAIVVDAIQSLPALYREPFVLRHVEGWSYRQIGEVMGLGESTIETRLVRARRLLREALKDKV